VFAGEWGFVEEGAHERGAGDGDSDGGFEKGPEEGAGGGVCDVGVRDREEGGNAEDGDDHCAFFLAFNEMSSVCLEVWRRGAYKMPKPKMAERTILWGWEICRFQIMGSGRQRTMQSMIRSRAPIAMNAAGWFAQEPPGVAGSQLKARGLQRRNAVRTTMVDHATVKAMTMRAAMRNDRMKNIRM